MSSSPPPQPIVTADDYSSIPSIISWFTAVTVTLCVLTKICTKFSMTRKFAADDVAHLLTLLFSLGMVVAVSLQSQNGLGKPEASLSSSQLDIYQKTAYSTQLLYIATLFFSKSSILVLLKALSPVKLHAMLIYGVAGVLALWAVTGIIVAAFQCTPPRTWEVLDTTHCTNQSAFWMYFGIMNFITELFLVALPAIVMSKVQIARERRFTITLVFALRVAVMAAIVAEVVFTNKGYAATDRTLNIWPVVVCQLFVQCLSIAFACAPYLKPFFVSLESGMIRMDDTRRRDGRSVMSYGHQSREKMSSGDKRMSHAKGGAVISYPMKTWTQITRGSPMSQNDAELNVERASQRSDSRIINTSTTIEIHSEGAPEHDH